MDAKPKRLPIEKSRHYNYPDGGKVSIHGAVYVSSRPDAQGLWYDHVVDQQGGQHIVSHGWRHLSIIPLREETKRGV